MGLYSSSITNTKKQTLRIYVVDIASYTSYAVNASESPHPRCLLFHKEKGYDIWECIHFTQKFNKEQKMVETNDCIVSMNEIIYSLIGCRVGGGDSSDRVEI